MDYQTIFNEYYIQYRGDSQIPLSTDPEWAIAAGMGNTAIRRWANVDAEDWDVLWTTAAAEGFTATYVGTSASPTITTYDCPDTMERPGGYVKMTDPVSAAYILINVVKLQDVQNTTPSAPFAYFIGNAQQGYQMVLNFSGSSNNGWTIDFPIYKKPTYFDTSLVINGNGAINEDGTTVTECPDSSFIINYMLAFRFRSNRNFPAYQTAKGDAETALKNMQQKNGTGTPGNTWNLNDTNSTGSFGI